MRVNEIVLYKMTSGETVVAEHIESGDGYVTICEPIALEMQQTVRGFNMMSTIWIPLYRSGDAPTVINLDTSHIMAQISVDEELEKYYYKTVAYLRGDMKQLKKLITDENPEYGELIEEMEDFGMDTITANTVVH